MSLSLLVTRPLPNYEAMIGVRVRVKYNNRGHAKEGVIKRVAVECDRFYYYDTKGNEQWRLVHFGYDPVDVTVM